MIYKLTRYKLFSCVSASSFNPGLHHQLEYWSQGSFKDWFWWRWLQRKVTLYTRDNAHVLLYMGNEAR